MSDEEAKRQLAELLEEYTVGSVLHLLAVVLRTEADTARQTGDDHRAELISSVEATLFTVGLGIDANYPG